VTEYPTERSRMPLHEREPRDAALMRGPRFLIYGAGGHGEEIAAEMGAHTNGFITDETLANANRGDRFIVAIGDGRARARCTERGIERGLIIDYFVHPRAHLAPNVDVAPGCIILPMAVLMNNVSLTPGVLVNIGALVGHDCQLLPYCSIQPGAKLTGFCIVEAFAYIGIGATLITKDKSKPLRIGEGAIVGGGSVVLEDVPAGETWAGVPARRVK
jgi:sugar O-acyltransferase (sialic acid O-acetyltransferase NeuD family)